MAALTRITASANVITVPHCAASISKLIPAPTVMKNNPSSKPFT